MKTLFRTFGWRGLVFFGAINFDPNPTWTPLVKVDETWYLYHIKDAEHDGRSELDTF